MNGRLLHIFRNSPLGRETLLQSLYFTRQINLTLAVHIPKTKRFLLYFQHDAVQVDLDDSYLEASDSALAHLQGLLDEHGVIAQIIEPDQYTASNLPDLPTDFQFMCSPRALSDKTSKIGLGHIGSKVRKILTAAHFPVLIPSPVFKPWKSVSVLFGGSASAVKAVTLGLRVSQQSGAPLDLFTQGAPGETRETYEKLLHEHGLLDELSPALRTWRFYNSNPLKENLYNVPHDALVVLGAYGHGLIKGIVFGSTMELVQSTLLNNLLVVGPNCIVEHFSQPPAV